MVYGMKKAGALFLLCVLLCISTVSFSGCAKYPAQKQTAQEAEPVLTFEDGTKASYDLYRFAFLSYLGRTRQKGSEEERFQAADAAARDEICHLYATFSLCRQYGVEPFAKEIDKEVSTAVRELIEGENGFGRFSDYLAAIRAANMTDAVYRLYVRQSICEEKLTEKLKEQNVIPTDDAHILDFFRNGEESARAMWCYLSPEAVYNAPDAVNTLYQRALAADDAAFSALALMYQDGLLNTTAAMKNSGMYVGRYQWSTEYEILQETIFSLQEGETSAPTEYSYWEEKDTSGVYIVRRVPMGEISLEDEVTREELTESYMLSMFGKMLEEEAARLAGTAAFTDFYRSLTLSDVQMPADDAK